MPWSTGVWVVSESSFLVSFSLTLRLLSISSAQDVILWALLSECLAKSIEGNAGI